MRYSLYGLGVESALRLRCLRETPDAPADVRLVPGTPSQFARGRAAIPRNGQWFTCAVTGDGALYLHWSGLFEFLISRDRRLIHYRRLHGASSESFNAYLLGQVLSFPLLARGYEPLHATAVAIDGRAVAFLGDCGYGKSTLAAAFLRRGVQVVTDDVLTVEHSGSQWIAHPGPARLKLFPRVAAKYLRRARRGTPLTRQTTKMVVPVRPPANGGAALPLAGLYLLPAPQSASARSRRIRLTMVAPERAFLELIRSTFNLIQVDRRRLETQFATFTQLARDVPVRRLSYTRRLSSLDAVCDAIIEQTTHDT